MEVEGFLADSVVVAEGKLYAQGVGWNMILPQTLPHRQPRIGIGMLIRVPYTATNQPHRFVLRVDDQDGNALPIGDAPAGTETPDGKVRRIEGEFNMGRPPTISPGDEQIVPLAVNIDGMVFEDAGAYRFVLEVDGTEVKSLPFRLNQLPQMRLAM